MYPLADSGRLAVVEMRCLTLGGTFTKMDLEGVPASFAWQGKARARAPVVLPLRAVLPGGGPGPPTGRDHRGGGALWLLLFRTPFAFLMSAFCFSLICV